MGVSRHLGGLSRPVLGPSAALPAGTGICELLARRCGCWRAAGELVVCRAALRRRPMLPPLPPLRRGLAGRLAGTGVAAGEVLRAAASIHWPLRCCPCITSAASSGSCCWSWDGAGEAKGDGARAPPLLFKQDASKASPGLKARLFCAGPLAHCRCCWVGCSTGEDAGLLPCHGLPLPPPKSLLTGVAAPLLPPSLLPPGILMGLLPREPIGCGGKGRGLSSARRLGGVSVTVMLDVRRLLLPALGELAAPADAAAARAACRHGTAGLPTSWLVLPTSCRKAAGLLVAGLRAPPCRGDSGECGGDVAGSGGNEQLLAACG